jgi:hypothetical protein
MERESYPDDPDMEIFLDELDREIERLLEELPETEQDPADEGAGEVEDAVESFSWECSCGQPNLDVEWTEKETVYGHCPACKQTIFWNDPEVFGLYDARRPFGFPQDPGVREVETENGDISRWYPEYKVRRFIVDPDTEIRRGPEVDRRDAGMQTGVGESTPR